MNCRKKVKPVVLFNRRKQWERNILRPRAKCTTGGGAQWTISFFLSLLTHRHLIEPPTTLSIPGSYLRLGRCNSRALFLLDVLTVSYSFDRLKTEVCFGTVKHPLRCFTQGFILSVEVELLLWFPWQCLNNFQKTFKSLEEITLNLSEASKLLSSWKNPANTYTPILNYLHRN